MSKEKNLPILPDPISDQERREVANFLDKHDRNRARTFLDQILDKAIQNRHKPGLDNGDALGNDSGPTRY